MIGRRRAARAVRVVRHRDEDATREKDMVAVEEPLEIRLSWAGTDGRRRVEALAVTMRTPGADFELAAGFLHGEGVVGGPEDVQEITYCQGRDRQDYNIVEVRLSDGVGFDLERLRRNFYTTSSCGVCGKASLEAVEAMGCVPIPLGQVRVAPGLIRRLPSLLEAEQRVFRSTGGLHGAALFTPDGEAVCVKEDVGRHNAVDKVLGHALLRRSLPATEHILVVSGRASFEIVQKALAASVPVLVAVGAASSLAVDLAARFGQTLVGFTGSQGFNVYGAPERIA